MLERLRTFPVPSWLPRVIWSSVACGFLVVGIILFTLTVLSDTEWVKESLIDRLERSIHGPIQIEALNLDLFPSPAVHITGLSFNIRDPSSVTFRTRGVEVSIGWQSFWHRRLLVSRIMIDEPELSLDVPMLSNTEEETKTPFPAIQELNIRKGQLHLLRQSEGKNSLPMDWEAIELTVTKVNAEGPSLIHLSASIPQASHAPVVTFDGSLTLLDQHESSSANEELALMPELHIQGQIEGSDLNVGQMVEFLRGHELDPPIYTKANVQGTVSYTFEKDHDLLDLGNVHVSLDDWTLAGQGSLTDIFQESPRLDISGSSAPIAIKQLSSLFPPDWIPEDVRAFLRDHQVVGRLELERGSFHLSLNEHDSGHAEGIIRVERGQFRPVLGQPLLTNVSGTVAFSPSTFQFSQVQGTIALFTMTTPQATLAFNKKAVRLSVPTFQISEKNWTLNGTGGFTSSSTGIPTLTVSASALPISVQHFVKILPEVWFPAAIRTMLTDRDIDGKMELLMGSVRWRDDEVNTLMPEGVIRVTDGQMLVDTNHPPLKNLSGGIVFESNLVRIVDVEATIEDSTVFVKEATVERKEENLWVDIQGRGLFSAHDVHHALLRDPRTAPLLEALSQFHDVEGNLRILTRIQGPWDDPSQFHILEGDLLLENIHLSAASNGRSLRQLNGRFSFNEQRIRIQQFSGQLGDSLVDLKGHWSFQKDVQSSNLTFTSSLLPPDLLALFPDIRQVFSTLEGPIETTMSFSGSTLRPAYQTKLDLTNTVMTAKGWFHKPLGVPATVELKGLLYEDTAVRLTKGVLSIPPYTLEAQGQLSWSNPLSIRGFFQTESGTGSMFPEAVTIGDSRLHLSSLGIVLGLEGQNLDWTTWSLKGKVEGSNRNSQSTTSETAEDLQSASLQWVQNNQRGKGEVRLNGIPIESLLVAQPNSTPALTGTSSLKTAFHMNIKSLKDMQESLTGEGSIQLQNGLIQTGPVLSKILRILNVPSLLMGKVNLKEEGLPYNEIAGTFTIDNGLLATKDLALKSPVIKLTAAGTYDLPTSNLNNIVAVSPFGAYSNLLKDIPLFGSLMKGERKGLLTALFEVKGTRAQPKVTYLPMASFTEGLKGFAQFPIDMLKNIIPLPQLKKETTEQVVPIK